MTARLPDFFRRRDAALAKAMLLLAAFAGSWFAAALVMGLAR